MKKIEINVSEKDYKILKHQSKKNPKEKVRNRAKVIILRYQGYSEKEIINKTSLALNTILTYIKDYKNNGLKSIYTSNYKARPSRLKVKEVEIIEDFKQTPPKSLKEGCAKIKEKYGIAITPTPLSNFLKKKGLSIEKLKQSLPKQTGKLK